MLNNLSIFDYTLIHATIRSSNSILAALSAIITQQPDI